MYVANSLNPLKIHTENLVSTIKWMGHQVSVIKDKLGITIIVAHLLHPLAARCVFFTSSYSFKARVIEEKVQNSRSVLMAIGGEETRLTMPDGSTLFGFYLDAQKCLESLLNKGAQKGSIPFSDDLIQDVLWIPENGEAKELIEQMHVSLNSHNGNLYINLGIPHPLRQAGEPAHNTNGTVIYAPGSGHLFEFRRKTVGSFLMGYGMNMFIFHYSGTGLSSGSISEQATYDNVEGIFNYLKNTKATGENKILGYGHCAGAGPVIDLAAKKPIHLIADRTQLNMGEFSRDRLIKLLYLPKFMHFLVNWVRPVMSKCFCYDNQEKIKLVRGSVAVIKGTNDDFIPEGDMPFLFNQAIASQHKQEILINSNHDMDLVNDESARLELGRFLLDAHLINHF